MSTKPFTDNDVTVPKTGVLPGIFGKQSKLWRDHAANPRKPHDASVKMPA